MSVIRTAVWPPPPRAQVQKCPVWRKATALHFIVYYRCAKDFKIRSPLKAESFHTFHADGYEVSAVCSVTQILTCVSWVNWVTNVKRETLLQYGLLRFVRSVQQQDSGRPFTLFCLHFCLCTNCSIPVVKGTHVAFSVSFFFFYCFLTPRWVFFFCFVLYGIEFPACLLVEVSESEVALHRHAKITVTRQPLQY